MRAPSSLYSPAGYAYLSTSQKGDLCIEKAEQDRTQAPNAGYSLRSPSSLSLPAVPRSPKVQHSNGCLPVFHRVVSCAGVDPHNCPTLTLLSRPVPSRRTHHFRLQPPSDDLPLENSDPPDVIKVYVIDSLDFGQTVRAGKFILIVLIALTPQVEVVQGQDREMVAIG